MHVSATAPAKINLTLEITGRRDDGYHLVHTVMQAITRRERAEVWNTEQPGLTLAIEGANLPVEDNNTALKAARAFFAATGMAPTGWGIRLHKRVPIGAGLAGGSADAAAVLAALNALTRAGLSTEQLCAIGAHVGADVPFCVLGGTALGTGTGTELLPLPAMPDCWIVVAKPADSISTAEAYRLIDSAPSLPAGYGPAMQQALREGSLSALSRGLVNAFDAVTALPGVEHIKQLMRRHHTLGCQMTGSGSAVFGLFDEEQAAESCAQTLSRQYAEVFVCRPDRQGARIESLSQE